MSARSRGWRPQLHGLHQWTGLSLGLIFVLLGLSGSWLAFYPELDQLLHPEQVAAPGAGAIPLAPVVAALRAAEPGRPGPWRIELPRWEGAPIGARYYHPAETRERHFAPLMLTLDPHSLRLSRKYFWGEDPSTWIYDLHYTLLLGDLGRTLLGGVAGLLLLLLLSGLLLWWPRPGRWRGALSIKAGAVWKRRIYDWHVKPGVYTLVLMLPLTLTGLMLVVPHWFAPLIEGLGPVSRNYQAPPRPPASSPAWTPTRPWPWPWPVSPGPNCAGWKPPPPPRATGTCGCTRPGSRAAVFPAPMSGWMPLPATCWPYGTPARTRRGTPGWPGCTRSTTVKPSAWPGASPSA